MLSFSLINNNNIKKAKAIEILVYVKGTITIATSNKVSLTVR